MDSADEIDIFDSSGDLFDDVDDKNTNLPVPGSNKALESQQLLNDHNKVSHNDRHLLLNNSGNMINCTEIVADTLHLSSDKLVAQYKNIAPFDEQSKECGNEHFNLNLSKQPTYVDEVPQEDSFEGLPNKRHKLNESEEALDDIEEEIVSCKPYAPVEVLNVSNHSSDEADNSTIEEKTAKENNTISARSTLSVSETSSLNEDVGKMTNFQCRNIDANSEKMITTNRDYPAVNGFDVLSFHKEMVTASYTRQVNEQILPKESSNVQTTSSSKNSTPLQPSDHELICPFCNIQQDSLYLMEIHIDMIHSETPNDDNKESAMLIQDDHCVNSEGNCFQFVCPLCDLDLVDRVNLDIHLLVIHEEEKGVEACEQEICPLCGVTFYSETNMKLHIKSHDTDQTVYGISESEHGTVFTASTTPVMTCPVCQLEMTDSDLLISHVESHFNSKHSLDLLATTSCKEKSGKENIPVETSTINEKGILECHTHKKIETVPTLRPNNDPSTSQKLVTPSNSKENLSYRRQYEQNLERAVTKGQMSVTDYYEQKLLMAEADMMGVDNGTTRTQGLIEKIELLYHRQARKGQTVYLCTFADHFSGSYGDKGWGCGYRNFQMILSCLAKHPDYAQRTFADGNLAIPSIPKIQQIIESAWKKGFDPQGSKQLGGQLMNTSKWIGATEIVATLSSLGVKCILADFHAPSAPDGTHPLLLEWVSNYFCTNRHGFLPPLYLQHQGHSRTIIGVEKEHETVKLLLFDPGTSRDQLSHIAKDQLTWKHMQIFRRTQAGFKSRQYQIVAIIGLLADGEYEESKILKSEQVS